MRLSKILPLLKNIEELVIDEESGFVEMWIRSQSEGDKYYHVYYNEDYNKFSCTCKGWVFRSWCKHLELAKWLLKHYDKIFRLLIHYAKEVTIYRKYEKIVAKLDETGRPRVYIEKWDKELYEEIYG